MPSTAVIIVAVLVSTVAGGLVYADARRRAAERPTFVAGTVAALIVLGFLAASTGLDVYFASRAVRGPAVTVLPRTAFGLVVAGGLAVAAGCVLSYGLLARGPDWF